MSASTPPDSFSYAKAGIDINQTDKAKKGMAESLATKNPRVMNQVGAFASLFDGRFPEIKHPILVMKTEEPGSKQLLAAKSGRLRSICYDMINHLVNDLMVMGATPLMVQDAIILGKMDDGVVKQLVDGVAAACRDNGCDLTGGETSIQPGVLEPGTFILTSSIVGIADKDKILDGKAIREGDGVIALPSNGLHTNGYTLVRALMDKFPDLAESPLEGTTFFDVIMRPHTPYYKAVKDLFGRPSLTGLAHITGGGIQDNLNRILPKTLDAQVELDKIRLLPVFKTIREKGNVEDGEMLRTFNCGVGLTLVCRPEAETEVLTHLKAQGVEAYRIGKVVSGEGKVTFTGRLNWN